MRDSEVKDRTGFASKALLLAFTGIVCNGDAATILKTVEKFLSWWEEWFLTYKLIRGRSWVNQKDLAKEYHLNAVKKNGIVDSKLAQILKCRNSWPRYVPHDEDVLLRSDKWDGVVGENERMIQHDSTNISMQFQPTLACSQKITYNQYYNGPCGKGEVELQPCGNMRTNHLFVGACSDSQYVMENRLFEEQQRFQEEDLVGEAQEILRFINVLDRGYKLNLYANRCGKQTVYQPIFRKSGKRFTGEETLQSASCASVRSGNERAVRKAKLAGFLRKGLRPNESPRRLDDVWLAWGFMCNFIYMSTA